MKKTLLAILACISIFAFSSQTSFAAESDDDNYRGRGGYGCYQDDDEYHHGDYRGQGRHHRGGGGYHHQYDD